MIYQLTRTPRKWRKIKNSNIWSSFRIVSQQTRNTWNSYVLIINICSKLNFRTPHHDNISFCEEVVNFEVLTQKSNEFLKGPSVMKNFPNLQKLCKHIWNITKKSVCLIKSVTHQPARAPRIQILIKFIILFLCHFENSRFYQKNLRACSFDNI